MGVYKRFHGELMRHGRIRMEFHYTMGLLKNDAENRTATLDKIDKKKSRKSCETLLYNFRLYRRK